MLWKGNYKGIEAPKFVTTGIGHLIGSLFTNFVASGYSWQVDIPTSVPASASPEYRQVKQTKRFRQIMESNRNVDNFKKSQLNSGRDKNSQQFRSIT